MPKVIFDGHTAQTRVIEPTADDLFAFRDAAKAFALDCVKHQAWDGPYYTAPQRAFIDLCEKFSVDYTFKKDRVAFATALIEFI
jgi:hypothetical protein